MAGAVFSNTRLGPHHRFALGLVHFRIRLDIDMMHIVNHYLYYV